MVAADATVVIVNWNARELLLRCLASLAEAGSSFDTIVVDNASTDGSAGAVAEQFPDVRVLALDSNRGFAGGNNAAFAEVETRYVVLLNNDATATPGFVDALVAAMDQPDWQNVAGASARLLLEKNDGDEQLVNSTGTVVRTDGHAQDRGWLRSAAECHPGDDVFGICGAAAILRTDALRAVGGFDDDYFLYYEDVDLSWRLRAAGWFIKYVDSAVAYHRHAASTVVGSPLFWYYNDRNRFITLTRHAPLGVVVRVLLRHPLALVRHIVRTRSLATTTARLRALAAYLRRLPTTIGERRRLWRDAPVSRRQAAMLVKPDEV